MALESNTYRYIGQVGFQRLIDVRTGPDGAQGTTSSWLVPTSGYVNGERFPHDVSEDLKGQSYDKVTQEGVEYYKVPEESSNTPGLLSHYAQRTGVAELENPPGGGVNRAAETFVDNSASASVAPDEVEKYVKDHDSFEDARKKQSEKDSQVARQVGLGDESGAPAREPGEGKLVVAESGQQSDSSKSTTTKQVGKDNK